LARTQHLLSICAQHIPKETMKMQLSIIVCTLALASAAQVEVTPVQKVVTLLNGMLERGKKEKHEEQVTYAAEKQSCDDTQAEKKTSIKESGQKIDGLKAEIEKDAADVASLTREIAAHDKDSSTWTGDKKAASSVRAIEKSDYATLHKDYSESIDAISRAIAVLKKQSGDTKQASLIQVSALQKLSLIPDDAKNAIDMFVQQGEEDLSESVAAPEANGYEFQSSGVVDMLSKLHSKFIDERTSIEKKEANSRNAFDLFSQDMDAQIKQAGKDKSSKSVTKASTLKHKADSTADKKSSETLKADDSKFLSDLTSTCSTKASDFQSRQELRTGEIQAIEKAIAIISGSAVSGSATKHLPGLVQESTSLSQLRSSLNAQMQQRVSQYLESRAATLNSRVLAAVAQHAGANPFDKVQKMIKGMVTKLLTQANEEAGHKGYCDTELATNKQTRTEKTDEVATLTAQIESLSASIAKLTSSIAQLGEQVASLDAAMAKSVSERTDEKAKNSATVTDAQEAQTAVAQALTVLKEFYAKAAEATSFIQAPYNGQQGESAGVLGMLDVIASDFARLESETNAAEATAEKAQDKFMEDSKVSKATKSAQVENKTEKVQDQKQALTVANSDLEGTQTQLSAALTYFDKLKPSCVNEGVTYAERVRKRKEEIESLQESLKIMSGDALA